MNLPALHLRRSTWALALAMALLLLTGWGQVHRVLHPGAPAFVTTTADAAKAAPGLAHEDGSGLCQLLDHLSQGAGPSPVWALALPAAVPSALPALRLQPAPALALWAFEARGPPLHR